MKLRRTPMLATGMGLPTGASASSTQQRSSYPE
jgi:hypothetical protein